MADDTWAEDTYEYNTLAEFEEELSENGQVNGQISVYVPRFGQRRCYLGTPNMDMRFQGPQETVIYGNHSLNWVIRNADSQEDDEQSKWISNAVTDQANVKHRPHRTETYLEVKNTIISDTEYRLQIKGSGDHFYFEYDADKKLSAIYTNLKRPEGKVKVYLQPASNKEYKIVARVGPPQYIFKLRSIRTSGHQDFPTFLFSGHFQGYILLVLCTLFVFVFTGCI